MENAGLLASQLKTIGDPTALHVNSGVRELSKFTVVSN